MSILTEICNKKRILIEHRKQRVSHQYLKSIPAFQGDRNSMKERILSSEYSGIIAEFKRMSPSKQLISQMAEVSEIIPQYVLNKASGISVLTDTPYFGGSDDDLIEAVSITDTPILRKDFIIDPYQITEAKALGASCILLIASCISPEEVKEFTDYAHEIGLEVLLELYQDTEIDSHVYEQCDLIGVNNRNLNTFEVDIEHASLIAKSLPEKAVKIAESGLSNPIILPQLREVGFDGFLIGEEFMKQEFPGQRLKEFANFSNQNLVW